MMSVDKSSYAYKEQRSKKDGKKILTEEKIPKNFGRAILIKVRTGLSLRKQCLSFKGLFGAFLTDI